MSRPFPRPPKRSILSRLTPLFLIPLFFFLSGCVYLRLLDVKRQLADFDRHFSIEGKSDLVIRFKKPVLFARDTRFLIGADRLSQSKDGREVVWRYEFESVKSSPVPKAPMEELSLRLHFLENLLTRIVVPETFLRLFHREVLVETLKQAANAEVLALKKTARVGVKLPPDVEALLPAREKVLNLMGPPLELKEEDGLQTLIYQYRMIKDKNRVPIIAFFGFSNDGLLRRMRVKWDTATVDMHFVRE